MSNEAGEPGGFLRKIGALIRPGGAPREPGRVIAPVTPSAPEPTAVKEDLELKAKMLKEIKRRLDLSGYNRAGEGKESLYLGAAEAVFDCLWKDLLGRTLSQEEHADLSKTFLYGFDVFMRQDAEAAKLHMGRVKRGFGDSFEEAKARGMIGLMGEFCAAASLGFVSRQDIEFFKMRRESRLFDFYKRARIIYASRERGPGGLAFFVKKPEALDNLDAAVALRPRDIDDEDIASIGLFEKASRVAAEFLPDFQYQSEEIKLRLLDEDFMASAERRIEESSIYSPQGREIVERVAYEQLRRKAAQHERDKGKQRQLVDEVHRSLKRGFDFVRQYPVGELRNFFNVTGINWPKDRYVPEEDEQIKMILTAASAIQAATFYRSTIREEAETLLKSQGQPVTKENLQREMEIVKATRIPTLSNVHRMADLHSALVAFLNSSLAAEYNVRWDPMNYSSEEIRKAKSLGVAKCNEDNLLDLAYKLGLITQQQLEEAGQEVYEAEKNL